MQLQQDEPVIHVWDAMQGQNVVYIFSNKSNDQSKLLNVVLSMDLHPTFYILTSRASCGE